LKDWFITWFNSRYYHLLYRNRNQREAELFIDNLVAHLNLPKGSRVLDLACGKGRHAVQLHKHGYEVVGLDLSEESIDAAKQFEQEGLDFFVHDMRQLYWHEHFKAVFNLFTSFGYFHSVIDDQRTINSVADSLVPGGFFVLDFFNTEKVVRNLVDYEERTIDGVQFAISRSVKGRQILKNIIVTDGELTTEFQEEVDALTLEDLENYCETAGLSVVQVFGDYDLGPFDLEVSERTIIVAQKNT
jgi:SAM-dependent methyltransferase